MTTEQPINKRTKALTKVGIIISWATFWLFLLLPFGLITWVGILIYLIIKKSKLKWYFILSAWLFVPSCNFMTGTLRYFTGTAYLQGVGEPEAFKSIDRETRLVSTSSGCILVGFEPFVFPANNYAVTLWTKIFGFQHGSYKGVFPTVEESQKIIKSADTIIVKHNDKFLQFNTSEQIVKVDTSDFYSYRSSSSEFDTVVGKAIKNECFIFQRIEKEDKEERKPIYIVDINNSKLLKIYFDTRKRYGLLKKD